MHCAGAPLTLNTTTPRHPVTLALGSKRMNSLLRFKIFIDDFTASTSKLTSNICTRVNWLYVRLSLIVFGVISTVISSTSSVYTIESIIFTDLLAAFIFCIVGLQFVIGIQAMSPQSDDKWLKPNWYQNPFNLGQPAHFFHFGGWLMLLSSLPPVISVVGESKSVLLSSLIPVIFGIGLLSGVHVSKYIFKKKYRNT